jgi:hypothetical protein
MKNQLFITLLALVFLSFCGVVVAEENTKKGKETVKNWRNNKRKRPGDAASSMIWKKYSRELAEIRKLRKKDPEAFKVKSKVFREKVRKEIKAEREKFKKLVMEYRKTKDPKTREAISKYVSGAYDRKLNAAAKRIAMQKERLEKAEKKLAEAKAKKEERINKILKTVLKDPKLNW